MCVCLITRTHVPQTSLNVDVGHEVCGSAHLCIPPMKLQVNDITIYCMQVCVCVGGGVKVSHVCCF